jgi:hypothetical protein
MAAKRAPAKVKVKAKANAKANGKPLAKASSRPRASAPPPPSLAVKLLGTLPSIDARLRQAYLASFTEAQCTALGEKTQAVRVLAEAVGWLPALHKAVQARTVGGYSARRLAFLAELVVALEDELGADEHGSHSGARASTLTWAREVKAELVARLTFVAGGREALVAQVVERAGSDASTHQVRDALTGLIELASRWRREPLLEALADDADLSAARLSAAYNALEALARTDEVLRAVVADGADSAGVNAVEGRILAELHLARTAFGQARAAGQVVPALPWGPSLRLAFPGEAV